MQRKLLSYSAVALACASFALPASAAPLVGRVFDSMGAVVFAGATVRIAQPAVETTTDRHGFFRIGDVQPGAYLAEVILPDGRRFTARIAVLPNRALTYAELDFSRIVPPDEHDEY